MIDVSSCVILSSSTMLTNIKTMVKKLKIYCFKDWETHEKHQNEITDGWK